MPGAPVHPILLRYARSPVDVNGNGPGGGYLGLLLAMLQLSNRLSVEYLPVYHPSVPEENDAALYASNLRGAMASALGVPTTAHSYDDARLQVAAMRHVVAPVPFELAAVRELFALGPKQVEALLARFHEMDSRGDGTLDEGEFRAAMGLHEASDSYVGQLFSFFDADESGTISFAEMLQGLAVVSSSCSLRDKIKLVFLMADLDSEGGVSLDSLRSLLRIVDETQPPPPPPEDDDDEGAPPSLLRQPSLLQCLRRV